MSSFEKCLFRSFTHFLIGLFLCYWSAWVVCIFWRIIHCQFSFQRSSVQSVQSCPTLCDTMNGSTPGLPVHHQLPEFTQTHVHRVGVPSSHLILCRPLLLLLPIPLSIRVFSIPKKVNAKECSNFCTTEFISQASKAMLKILQARLQISRMTIHSLDILLSQFGTILLFPVWFLLLLLDLHIDFSGGRSGGLVFSSL